MSSEQIHKNVAEHYGSRIADRESEGGGCSCGCGVAERTGYTDDDIAAVPADVAGSTFGCGNPLAFCELQPGQVVLDLGSGAGLDLLLAAGRVGDEGRVIGVDMTDAMIERANKNIAASGRTNVEVRKGLIESMPVDDASVDWVISNCVVNLSPRKNDVFAEIHRVLNSGGRFRISDIVVQSLPDSVRSDTRIWGSCIGGAISEEDYANGLRAAGLTDVKVADRVVYSEKQLAAMLTDTAEAGDDSCGCGGLSRADALKLATELGGTIQSLVFTGCKC